MRFQIGAFFPTRDMPPDHVAIRDWAQAAEAIGFDFVEVSDHVLGADRAALPDFQGPYDVNDAFHETFVPLAYTAAADSAGGQAGGPGGYCLRWATTPRHRCWLEPGGICSPRAGLAQTWSTP